eukprot:350510_1
MSDAKPLQSVTKEWIISADTNPSLDEIKNASVKQCFVRNITVGKLKWRVKYYPNGSSKKHAGNSSVFIYMVSKPSNISSLLIKCKISWIELDKTIDRRKIIKNTGCIILKPKLIQLSKLQINKLTMRISITIFEIYDENGSLVITHKNDAVKAKEKFDLSTLASMEAHRKRMEIIAKNVQKFDLSKLPEYYSKYFKSDIKSVFNGKLKKLIIHFGDMFVIQTKKSGLIVISKIYNEEKNDDHEVKSNEFSADYKPKKNVVFESMKLRKQMQFIAQKVQQFDLSKLPEYYSKYFQCDIKSVFNGKLKKLIIHFGDMFVIQTKKSGLIVISKIYNEEKNDDHEVKSNEFSADYKPKKNVVFESMKLRKQMQFIAQKVQQFDLSKLPEYYSKYFKSDIKSVFNGKLKKLIIHFGDMFVIQTKKSGLIVISKIYNEEKNDDHEVKSNEFSADYKPKKNVVFESMKLRKQMQFIAQKVQQFDLSKLPEYYSK